jgi:elongation factor P
MDQEFNLTPLNYEQVEDALKWIKENDPVIVRSYKGVAFSVECENFVILRVTQADPSVKGNTATNATKEAILETGAKIQVPMFVEEGELIRVDTRTHEYMERVKG